MINIKKIAIICLISLLTSVMALSQEKDTMAIVTVANISVPAIDTVLFDIFIERKSENWEYFVNSTFELNIINDGFIIDENNQGIEYIDGSSILDLSAFPGSLPTATYLLTPRIIGNRISITITGPDSLFDCEFIPNKGEYLLGTFKIFTKDKSPVPMEPGFNWLTPTYYWQACAYKNPTDVIDNNGLIWALSNDNIEMDNGEERYVHYKVNGFIPPKMILDTFFVRYDGTRKVYAYWRTSEEAYNEGFILRRAYRPFGYDKDMLTYDVKVADYRGSDPREQFLTGLGTRKPGQEYHWEHDTVPRRSVEYCYELSYRHFDGNEYVLARECLPIPNAVITFAQAEPNPFEGQTTINYTLDDDVKLIADVYDLQGKKVERLIDNPFAKIGNHSVDFEASILAMQGVYNVIFVAYPIDDPSIEISRAIVKMQLIR